MRVIVTGGRAYDDASRLYAALDALHNGPRGPITAIIQGGAHGADMLARQWGDVHRIRVLTFHADWTAFGRRAGPARNARMIAESRPDLVMAFPGGPGTADCVRQAKAAGIEVLQVGEG